MTDAFTTELLKRIIENAADYAQPLLFAGARIHTFDSVVEDLGHGDILLGDGFIVGIGPGLLTAAGDDNALVIDCTDMVIVPAVVDARAALGLNGERSSDVGTLWPGNSATFAVIPAALAMSPSHAVATLLGSSESVAAIVVDGKLVQWNGERLSSAAARPDTTRVGEAVPSDSPHLGMWIDENDFVHQELTPAGRYDEARGGRAHAFEGSFWIDCDRIDYLDDLGFWAFGEFVDGVLHHGPYLFTRRNGDETFSGDTVSDTSPHPYVGMWETANAHVRHELLADGRYVEARGSREAAYTGSYVVTGDHIDYLDDTGFTADGEFVDGVFHHGGMVLYRTA